MVELLGRPKLVRPKLKAEELSHAEMKGWRVDRLNEKLSPEGCELE
jgi:hypothetical protein